MLRSWYGLNQSGAGWTKRGLTPEWGSSTPEGGSYILAPVVGHEIIVEGDALTFLFKFEGMVLLSLKELIVGWREHYRDSCHEQVDRCKIDFLLVSMSEIQTRVCDDTNSFAILNFAWGMLKTGVSILPPEFCLIEGFEAY